MFARKPTERAGEHKVRPYKVMAEQVEEDREAYQASHRFARISPRKARLLMDLVRGRDVDDAISLLRFSKQRASGMVEKVIRSAVANANERDVPPRNTLFVAKAWVDPGPVIKRFQPKDRGKAYPIKKRTSHLVVALDQREE